MTTCDYFNHFINLIIKYVFYFPFIILPESHFYEIQEKHSHEFKRNGIFICRLQGIVYLNMTNTKGNIQIK